jgi:hypothetical protein
LFTFKREFVEMSINLVSKLAAETRLAEGQRLEEQMNLGKLRIFRAGVGKM